MKQTLYFASGNPAKAAEIRAVLPEPFELVTLAELGYFEEIEETGTTLEENAFIKANFLYKRTGGLCIADDSGLEVAALGGRPGVLSARFAGTPTDDTSNMVFLLKQMEGLPREARFRTVIACVLPDSTRHFFEGVIAGQLAECIRGHFGFGYDPLFIPEGFDQTFGELDPAVKRSKSHRTMAIRAMLQFLTRQQ
ncbi:MAG: RdgB/HAM1 family non-canonical purine NTP pyrophosphatase [Saprospiraceae bacterium]|nr:RdgB/HAM1 family non-canonical purine NTP pyrophosphatase [Saprospiraceae bacterium]